MKLNGGQFPEEPGETFLVPGELSMTDSRITNAGNKGFILSYKIFDLLREKKEEPIDNGEVHTYMGYRENIENKEELKTLISSINSENINAVFNGFACLDGGDFNPTKYREFNKNLLKSIIKTDALSKDEKMEFINHIKNVLIDYTREKGMQSPTLQEIEDEVEQGVIRTFLQRRRVAARTPEDLQRKYSLIKAECMVKWKQAREAKDYRIFQPWLQQLFDLKGQIAKAIDPDRPAFDTLVGLTDEGARVDEISREFDVLKEGLRALMVKISHGTAPEPVDYPQADPAAMSAFAQSLARELGCGDFIKIEVIRDSKYLMPDNYETIKATEILAKEGFVVLPYISPDLMAARDLVNAGAAAIMPLAAPIGSNKGLITRDFVKMLIDEIDLPIVVDAGIGRPSHACEAMELGADAVLANTAVATARDVVAMAHAFKLAVEAGREGYLAGPGRVLEYEGEASSPLTGFLQD